MSTYYWIDDNRGHDALNKFFAEEFAGVLVTDFWAASDAYAPRAQKCWAHLLRSETRSILMSVYRTLKQRGVDPLAATAASLRVYAATGVLPPLAKPREFRRLRRYDPRCSVQLADKQAQIDAPDRDRAR